VLLRREGLVRSSEGALRRRLASALEADLSASVDRIVAGTFRSFVAATSAAVVPLDRHASR